MGQSQPPKAKPPQNQPNNPPGDDLLRSQTLPDIKVSQDAELQKLQRRWLELNVQSAAEANEAASKKFESVERLSEKGLISSAELFLERAKLRQAEFQHERAKLLLEMFDLKAKPKNEKYNRGEALPIDNSFERIPNPFAHDAGFQSLRGLASYDDETQSWSIIYDDKPPRDDQFGGVFTLTDHRSLANLKNHDVIYIEGHISETAQDDSGKPIYVIEHLNKLKPVKKQQAED